MKAPNETLAKAITNLELIAKAHVGSYTRVDGTFVKEHDDGRVAAAPKPAGAEAAGGFSVRKNGSASLRGEHDDGHAEIEHRGGKFRAIIGNEVKGTHDNFDAAHAQATKLGGTFADTHVAKMRAHVSGGSPNPATKKRTPSKPLHHSDLMEGDEIEGPDGQKHEYLATHRGLGRMQIETRAGYKHPTEKDGTLPGWKKTGRNNA